MTDENKLIIPLKKPLKHGEREIKQLEVRAITAEDLEALGPLYAVNMGAGEDVSPVVQPKTTIKYLSRLCALPPSVIKQMGAFELDQAGWQLFNFFTQC